jgi:biopolymer transport protein ExbB/TolQ
MIRVIVALVSMIVGLLIVVFFNLVLPPDSVAARLLVDKSMIRNGLGEVVVVTRPFAVQTFMWIAFAMGIGEILLRVYATFREREQLSFNYLPESPDVLLGSRELVPIYQRVQAAKGHCFLPALIRRVILQFQSSKSVDRSDAMLNSSLELFSHEISLRFNFLKFLCWLLPSLGFLGTVIGIIAGLDVVAVEFMEKKGEINLASVTGALGVAFYTTWLALILASILLFLVHITEEWEEATLNRSAQYCLDHLINKLYEK